MPWTLPQVARRMKAASGSPSRPGPVSATSLAAPPGASHIWDGDLPAAEDQADDGRATVPPMSSSIELGVAGDDRDQAGLATTSLTW
jgi:hypothetical protein